MMAFDTLMHILFAAFLFAFGVASTWQDINPPRKGGRR